jgi:hypothetical protein
MAEGRTGMPETQPFRIKMITCGSWYVPRAARDLDRKNRVFKNKIQIGYGGFSVGQGGACTGAIQDEISSISIWTCTVA